MTIKKTMHKALELGVSTPMRRGYPVEAYSWKILNSTVAIKSIDKSCIEHQGTGVPQAIRFFFNAKDLDQTRKLELVYRQDSILARLTQDKLQSRYKPRLRMFWTAHFSRLLRKNLPMDGKLNEYGLAIRFLKMNPKADKFEIQLIKEENIVNDSQISDELPQKGSKEGRKTLYYATRYERDPNNRKRALEIHGYTCAVCDFDFGTVYGDRGLGYIEIHHTKPLGQGSAEVYVNPQKDLVPLCANCHRIIHRFRDDVLSIDDLKKIIKV